MSDITCPKGQLKNGKKIEESLFGTSGREYYKTRQFFNCDCATEGLVVEDIVDVLGSDNHYYHSISIGIWILGKIGHGPLYWKDRLRWCWHILKSGNPWADTVILVPSEAERFAKDILRRIDTVKKAEKKLNARTAVV